MLRDHVNKRTMQWCPKHVPKIYKSYHQRLKLKDAELAKQKRKRNKLLKKIARYDNSIDLGEYAEDFEDLDKLIPSFLVVPGVSKYVLYIVLTLGLLNLLSFVVE